MWNEFDTKKFVFSERNATIIFPKVNANGKMLIKTEQKVFGNAHSALQE